MFQRSQRQKKNLLSGIELELGAQASETCWRTNRPQNLACLTKLICYIYISKWIYIDRRTNIVYENKKKRDENMKNR